MTQDIDTLFNATSAQEPEFNDSEFSALDSLFSQASATEPELVDDNFTKMVVNSLPTAPKRTRVEKKSLSFDIIGIALGLIAAYSFFDVGQFFDLALSVIPESSMSIGFVSALSMTIGVIGVSGLTWWATQQN